MDGISGVLGETFQNMAWYINSVPCYPIISVLLGIGILLFPILSPVFDG